MNGAPNALVNAAAAEIADHGTVDLVVGGVRSPGEESGGRHHLAGLAVSALRHLLGDPRELDRVTTVGRESLDGGDLLRPYRRYGTMAMRESVNPLLILCPF